MNSVQLKRFCIALLLLIYPAFLSAQTLTLERVASGLSSPLFATFAPGDSTRLYIVQRSGQIRILNLTTGNLNGGNFINVPGLVSGGEQGLLGLAFHPDFENNNFFYVNFTDNSGGDTRITRFTATSPDSADASSGQLLLEFNQPQSNHNGGWIGFGNDGFLYIATGDGGGANDTGGGHTAGIGNSQDITNNLLGKMLRIDVDGDDFPGDANRNYAIPASNPFVGVTGDDEIYIYGLRNPFRSSFDRANGDLYIADVGQNAREEIDVLPGGGSGGENMGWRLREGTIQTPGVGGPQPGGGIEPIYDYLHNGGNFGGFSVTGGYVYRGPVTGLQGNYFFADFVTNNLWSLRFDGSDPSTHDGTNFDDLIRWNDFLTVDVGTVGSISSFGEDLEGNMYIVDLGGEVFRVVAGATGALPGTLNTITPVAATFESGNQADLDESNDTTVKYRAVDAKGTTPLLQLEFEGTVPLTSPSVLTFEFEARTSTLNLNQTIELFNYVTNQFVEFDSRNAIITDELLEIETTNNQFIGPAGVVRSRVTLTATGPVVAFPWPQIMDRVGWTVLE